LTDALANTSRKWRPSLSLVVFLVLTSVLSLPLFSLYFLKVYQNQLIQQTEAELIAQSAALSAVFHREVETGIPQSVALGTRVPPAAQKLSDEPYQPIWPALELASESVLPPRPEARTPSAPADPTFVALGARMIPDLIATQNVTLAGFRLLRSERYRHCWPQRSRPVTRASRRSKPSAAGTLQRRLARAHLQA
jgi:hypothetical protein